MKKKKKILKKIFKVIPGFKFSRASYLCSLLRNEIIEQLELKTKYGLELIPR